MGKLTPNAQRLHAARQYQESLTELANTAYYLFVGYHVDREVTTPVDSHEETTTNTYRNMIMGKRVSNSDVALLIRNIPYESNTIYDMYDDTDEDLFDKDYYVIIDEGTYSHIYKCLDNNMGSYSTVQPTFAHITGANTEVYATSDGYYWKYMYSITSNDYNKFSTPDYIPLIPNTAVSANAVEGTIDRIVVDGTGQGYDNYITGTFSTTDLRIGGNGQIYAIAQSNASSTNGFYTGCLIYLSTGTGAGQYKKIDDYYSNNSGKYLVTNSAFTTAPLNGTQYQIYPEVIVTGSGKETVNAVARALVNSIASNSIYRVEMLNRGIGYDYATANVTANAVVDVSSNAEIRPIMSPNGGHGYDAAAELGANSLMISLKLSNSESNTIVTTNQFQQIGLIKDPLFSNSVIQTVNKVGTFTTGEKLYKLQPVRINTNATINTTSTQVNCATAVFSEQISANDFIYLRSSSNTGHMLTTVNVVTNNTFLTLASNGKFACTETMIYQANVSTIAYAQGTTGANLAVSNVTGTFSRLDLFIGWSSGAVAQVNAVFRKDTAKYFNTFINMYKYTGTLDSGTFQENETVYQGSLESSNALLHSAIVDGGSVTIYTTDQKGVFDVGGTNTVIGNTSGAIATITGRHEPELVHGTGTVLFLENIEAVTRTADTSETFQLILDF